MAQTTVSNAAEEAFLRAGLVSLQPGELEGSLALTDEQLASSTVVARNYGPARVRENISETTARTLTTWGMGSEEQILTAVQIALSRFSDSEVLTFAQRALRPVNGFEYRASDPVAREIALEVFSLVCRPPSSLEGVEHLEPALGRNVVFLGNHLTRFDPSYFNYMLAANELREIVERVNLLASHNILRYPTVAHLALGSGIIPVPRSPSVSPHSRAMDDRELASAWRQALGNVHARLDAGEAVLIFPEGGHTDECAMGEFMPPIARYLTHPRTVIQPFGLWGAKDILPSDAGPFRQGAVHFRFGPPIDVQELYSACPSEDQNKIVMDTLGFIVAGLLPDDHKGIYGPGDGSGAREVARHIAQSFAA